MKENYRSRKHCLLLYDEDITHKKAMEYITKHYDYAMIKHDKDCDENGELKKEHYHLIVEFKTQKWRSVLAKELEITENYIEQVNNYEKALEYLIHYNDDDKYHYELDEVTGTLKSKLKKLILNEDKDENERVEEILDYINTYDDRITIMEFSKWCANVGKWDVFRRAWGIYIRIIDEHNQQYADSQKEETDGKEIKQGVVQLGTVKKTYHSKMQNVQRNKRQ